MQHHGSASPAPRGVAPFLIGLLLFGPNVATGQTATEPLYIDTGALVPGDVVADGDLALASGGGFVSVLERQSDANDWRDAAVLRAGDQAEGFGRSLAIGHDTAVVGATGAAYVFERRHDHTWFEAARLAANDEFGHEDFGASVSISGSRIVVASPAPRDAAGGGAAYVFERRRSAVGEWVETARLVGPRAAEGTEHFAESVSAAGDTVVVAAVDSATRQGVVYVYSRRQRRSHRWDLEATLPASFSLAMLGFQAPISANGDLVAAWQGGIYGQLAGIYQRDRGGPGAWGRVPISNHPYATDVSISDNTIVVAVADPRPVPVIFRGAVVYGRNQGGADMWGEVARMRNTGFVNALSGDTLFLSGHVYVSDVDRDGIRDQADRCARDPLNDVLNGCQRASELYPTLDDILARTDITTSTRGTRTAVTATYRNTSATPIMNPFFEVTAIGRHAALENAEGNHGGVGATLSPDVGDGILQPAETMTVRFVIRHRRRGPGEFAVRFRGEPAS